MPITRLLSGWWRAPDRGANGRDPGPSLDPFQSGRFPVCPETHDQGLRWLFDLATVLLLLDCRPGDRVLDLGAGSGFSSETLARLGYSVVAVDPDCAALINNRARPERDASRISGRVTVASGVAEALPFADQSFDGAVAMNVLHHVPDLASALAELSRVLRPGSRLVFCEPGLDHLQSPEAQRAIREHGEDDRPFDVLALLQRGRSNGFREAMLSATVQSPLALLPVEEIDEYLTGQHRRAHLRADGILEELHRRHAYGMLVKEGAKPRTSRNPGVLARQLDVRHLGSSFRRGESVTFDVDVLNTGDTLWLSEKSSLGGYVTVGVKLLTETGLLIDDALGRTPLPHDVAPGDSVRVSVRAVLPASLPPGGYCLEVDLVDELVCWFADVRGALKFVRSIALR